MPAENFGRPPLSETENAMNAPPKGNQEVLNMHVLEQERYGRLFRDVMTFTPQSILYTQVPENTEAQKKYVPVDQPLFKRRTDVINDFRRLSDRPDEFTDGNMIQHLQSFSDAGYIQEEYRKEPVMGMPDRDVVYVRESLQGANFARPAAYLAQLFELRFGVSVASVMTESVVSEGGDADRVNSHISMLLLHLHATKQGLHPLELQDLTDTASTTITSRLRQLMELGLVHRFRSAYWKNDENPFPTPQRNYTAPSKAALIRHAIDQLPNDTPVTPGSILALLTRESQNDSRDQREVPDEEFILKELSALAKHGHLKKAAPSTHSIYQLTDLGRGMTEALLVPLIQVVKGRSYVPILDGHGGHMTLDEAISQLRLVHGSVAPELLRQYRLHGKTPEAREERTVKGMRNALRVFDDVEGAVAAGAIRKQAQILPFDWKPIIDRMLQEGYVVITGRAARGREFTYARTPKANELLDE